MVDYQLPAYVLSRLRYYDGEFLRGQDFIDEQNYHLDARRRHERLLHVAGVLEGLDVTKVANATGIDVAVGSAVDGEGRQILLPQRQTIATLPGDGAWVVAIAFTEDPTDKADKNSVVDDYTRFTQGAAPVSIQPALPPGALLLAEVSIVNGRIANVDQSNRSHSGLRLPGPANTGASGSLRSQGDMAPGWVDLGCSLSLLGDQTIGGSLSVTGSLTVAARDLLAEIDDLIARSDAFETALTAMQSQVGPPGPPGPAGPPGASGTAYNPRQVAILRWYEGNTGSVTFAVGTAPNGIAFDGVNMWIANNLSNTVTKLSPSGATLGTFAVGTKPLGMAFDGLNMWVVNYVSNTVTKLSPSGATLGTFAAGNNPIRIAFDGANMWVTAVASSSVTKLSPTGATLGTFAVGSIPAGIAFDGANMWVANQGSNTVTKLSSAGATLGTFAVGNAPIGIAFDGVNMWVTNFNGQSVTKLSPSGATLGTFAVNTPYAIAFDGENMWVAGHASNTVTKLSPSGATLGTFVVGNTPAGIAFDGANMWVTMQSSGTVMKL